MIDAIKTITDNYKTIINNGMFDNIIRQHEASIRGLRKALDPIMAEMKNNAKIMAKRSLELGFYPSNQFSLYKNEFINLKNEDEEIIYICKKIKELLNEDYIKEISIYFDKSKIIDIYNDYCNIKYDDAVIKLIVLINSIINNKLDGTSSEELKEISRKLNNIITGIELPKEAIDNNKSCDEWEYIKKIHSEEGFEKYAYYIFMPYYYTSEKRDNVLYRNCYNKKIDSKIIKQKYSKIPYNRNAIIHGYVEDYGTEENCLRWFSVLINTYELFKLLEELSVSE